MHNEQKITHHLCWPLEAAHIPNPFPYPTEHPGRFGAVRKHDRHTGVDLYANPDDPVYACEAGTVVAIEWFTGVNAHSPWWFDTQAVLVEGSSGVILYGEIKPASPIIVGSTLVAGQQLGRVLTVLKHDKGRPRTMLHLELYRPGIRSSVWWKLQDPQPEALLDPTPLLTRASLLACLV